MMNETIGQVIRRLRKERNITQEELAEALGVTPQAVSKWENVVGNPDISCFVPLANFFDVSMDTLFSREAKSTDAKVSEFLEALSENNMSFLEKFDALSEALLQYPNHPDLLKSIVSTAKFLVKHDQGEQTQTILQNALKAADTFMQQCRDSGEKLHMQAMKVEVLSCAGYFSEAERLVGDFNIPIITEHMYRARICREKKDVSGEILHRQESISLLLGYLAAEIADLGRAYRTNGFAEEAFRVHSLNLKLPYLIHGETSYHAPLQNYHNISGFEAAYCLVLLKRYEEALDLLEQIFDYAAIQCPLCRNHAPLTTPLLSGIDMTCYHGEDYREADYLWIITADEFAEAFHDNPRYTALLRKFEEYNRKDKEG